MLNKRCSKCDIEYPATTKFFHKGKNGKYGLRGDCKKCNTIRVGDYNKTTGKIYHKNSEKKHRDSKTGRKCYIKWRFGATDEQADQIIEQQDNGVCDVCNKPETLIRKEGIIRLSVDHNHKTNKIRGVLCSKCNQVLGQVNDSIEILLNLAIYLEKHK